VGRLQTIKNQTLLARAFVRFVQDSAALAESARLVVVGEGPLRADVESILERAGMSHLAWLPGARDDVAAILQMLDVFVLPSLAEGTSCTLQEAMATGLPVIATAVGGNPELVHNQVTGWLVPSGDESAMAKALAECEADRLRSKSYGQSARARAEAEFGIQATVARYETLFTPQ
jgi:glycosyltransferase involved in cell wall biosynthesis